MDIKIKNSLLINLFMILGFVFSNSFNNVGNNQFNFSNDLLNLNKLDHNFNFSLGTQSNNFGSSSYYSIGDKITYNFSEKLMFLGDFNLTTSLIGANQFDNTFNQPSFNYDLSLRYNFNENSNIQLRIIKNSLNKALNNPLY